MKQAIVFVALISCIMISCTSYQQQFTKNDPVNNALPPLQDIDSLREHLNTILDDSLLSQCFIGIKIISLPDGKLVFERSSNKLFHPASNLKLITTAAGLHLLDTSFHCKTEIFLSKNISRNILRGNLYVKGFGDPMFTTGDLDSIVASLRARDIKVIKGDLVGDISYFDDIPWGRGWMWDDEPDADEAFISPLTINSNAIEITVEPARKIGKHLNIKITPTTSYIQIINESVTSNDTLLAGLQVTRNRGTNNVYITGRMSPGTSPRNFSLSVYQPEMYFLHQLKERLGARGITVKGSVRLDTVTNAIYLREITHPTDSLLHQINKPSDNIAAENLLKILGAVKRGIPGTSEHGLSVVKDFLRSIGVDTTAMILADGSGVSAYNIITPDGFVRLLEYEYTKTKTFQRYYESLPIAGVDGTLRNRMLGTPAQGNVHAKTGSLTGVSALSGYVTTSDGKFLAFSILANHFPSGIGALRNMQDNIMNILASYRGAFK